MLNIFIAASITLAVWLGGAPLGQIFSVEFLGTFVAIYVFTLVIVRLLWFFRSPAFMVGFYIFAVGLSYNIGPLFKYIMNDMPTYEMGADAPIVLERVRKQGVPTGEIIVVNKNADPMISANFVCHIYYDNGEMVQATYKGGFGGRAQYPIGFSRKTAGVETFQFRKYRSNPESMQCVVTDATFVKSPTYNVALKYEKNPVDSRTDFYVTNNDVVAIKNIQFQCANERGMMMPVRAFPAYLTDARKDTIVAPNTTVKFISNEAYWNYSTCFVSNAVLG